MMKALAAAVGALALIAIPVSASADTSDFTFQSFDADYTLSQAADGTSHVEVIETIVAVFPDFDQNRGILRDIPKYYNKVDTNITVESVTDENGNDVYYEADDIGNFTELALGTDDFVHGATTYVISYSMDNVVGTFTNSNDDEFYWDVNGTGWEQPFGSVSTTVHVEAALVPALTGEASCYRGAQGATDTCDITTDGSTFTASTADLSAGDGMTVAIGFSKSTFVQGEIAPEFVPLVYTYDTPIWAWVLAAISILGTAALLAGAIASRARRKAAAPQPGFIVPQYTVPKNLNVMVAAHFVGRGTAAVAAELVSLAVRKNIRILDYPVTASSGAEYTLQYLSDDGADAFDTHMLDALFGDGREAGALKELEPADVSLGRSINGISTLAAGYVESSGLRPAKKSWGCLPPILAGVLFGVSILNQALALGALTLTAVPVVGIVVSLALLIATSVVSLTGRKPLSQEGQDTRDYLEGMLVYMQLAEKDRFAMLQSPEGAERVDVGDTKQIIKLYEKLLPWAVMWGVENQWTKELEVHVASEGQSPDWFVSNTAFSAYALTSALSGVASTTTYTPPSSSGSSSGFGGAGGGGFSGGGGGGGGGGGR